MPPACHRLGQAPAASESAPLPAGRRLLAFVAIAFGVLAAAAHDVATQAADRPDGKRRTVVIAHRGEHTDAPENSLSAITNAIKARIDYVEADVRQTADGEYVLMHDGSVDRTTDGKGRVNELMWAELQRLRLKKNSGEQTTEAVPRLAEALEAMRGRIGLYLDYKSGDRAEIVRLVKEHGMEERTWVYCDTADVGAWRALGPRLRFIVSPEPGEAGITALARLAPASRPEVLDGDVTEYTLQRVQAAHARGFLVWPDIQGPHEDDAFWRQMTALGLDGMQSDNPAGLVKFLEGRQRTNAAAPAPSH